MVGLPLPLSPGHRIDGRCPPARNARAGSASTGPRFSPAQNLSEKNVKRSSAIPLTRNLGPKYA